MKPKTVTAIITIASIAGLIAIYYQKTYAIDLRRQHVRLEKQLKLEQDTLSILQAEWAHMVRPENLEKWKKQRRDISITRGNQIVTPADLEHIAKFHVHGTPEATARIVRQVSRSGINVEDIVQINPSN